jgi:hypothetical protein
MNGTQTHLAAERLPLVRRAGPELREGAVRCGIERGFLGAQLVAVGLCVPNDNINEAAYSP